MCYIYNVNNKSTTMETDHKSFTRPTTKEERPAQGRLPRLTADDFCKAKYSHNDKRCYTARMMDVFLNEDKPFVAAYKEFRLASMDYMYKHHQEDHAASGEQRAAGWNAVAESLGYTLVPMDEFNKRADLTLEGYHTKNGLLYRGKRELGVHLADAVARERGFLYAEQLVKFLEEK